MNALAAAAATLVFTLFDLLVFPWVVNNRPALLGWYRVTQGIVQCALYAGAWALSDWTGAAATLVVWWTGGCDVLFYWLGGYKWHTGRWPWLWWTPAGLWRFLPTFLMALTPGSLTCRAVLDAATAGREKVILEGTDVLWQAGVGAIIACIIIAWGLYA
jgi:hypothetical protein